MRSRVLSMAVGALVLVSALAAFALPRSQLRGRPQIEIGRELGYFLWMDGAVLHIRWTTLNPENHVFRGEVIVQQGDLTNLTRVSLETSDRATLESPQRLEWNATEHLGLDGLDITLPGPAKVLLFIDNRPAQKPAIFLGGRKKNPTAVGEIEIAGR
ncbi:MAG: hypothetical protein HYY06_03105 [Deltaproteobacteria bacterium]|nr:hypothetical protein [Deltaproteobacteria bacterium]